MSIELESLCQISISRTMRYSGNLRLKLLNWWAPPNRLFLRHKHITNADKLPLRALNGVNPVQFLMDDDDPNPNSVNLLKETNFALKCAKFPCIKIGDSPLIKLYGEDDTILRLDSELKHLEEIEKVDKKFPEPWHSLGPTLVKPVPQSFKEENLEEKFVEEPLPENRAHWESILDRSLKFLPNTTSRLANLLEKSGFPTIRKLLNHFPRTYADLQNAQGAIEDGHYFMFKGKVISSKGMRGGAQFGILEVLVGCEIQHIESNANESKMVYLHLKRFYRGTRFTSKPFLDVIASEYKEGDHVYISGKVKKKNTEDHYEMQQYNIDMLEKEEQKYAHLERKPCPVYPAKNGLKPNIIGDVISRALKALNNKIDPMPSEVLSEFNLLNLFDAYLGIHRPKTLNDADLARRRLIFDEFFYLQLGRLFQMLEALGTNLEREELLARYRNDKISKVCISEWGPLTRNLLKSLPYSLTSSQLTALSEIILDLKRPIPMNRLLQGDVGCGKTIVAFLSCMEVLGSGFQAALMVPTELLAIQHYQELNSLLELLDSGTEGFKPTIALLTGSTSTRERRIILKGLQSGDISMVIGTHSLISEKIEFRNLKIAVIDEQHRFGVVQRGRFNSKLLSRLRDDSMNHDFNSDENKAFMAPHILALSATPIPRTLALALHGDMSITQITDLPPGRQPIETLALEGNEAGFEKVYKMMKDELVADGKIYLVYPIIEESEQLPELHAAATDYESISGKFEGYNCSLLHGRMKAEEKEEALTKFRDGQTRILLATQVIEIGVDVPDASMMVVMNAERFGMAQLHQLRGRVGRGSKKSRCVFLSSTSGTLKRLKVLEKSSDGFYLAQADLLLRGPGDLLGKKQSGHLPEFPVARLEIDGDILQKAHLAALKVLSISNNLEKYPGLKAELSMRQPLCILGD
ncbi:ATP-dependent DNA helicase RecG [Rhynchospora pubera]|uniref:DNA 3'-5' helicase n=1 Tax=Rhynchospora pubera TaxID=906938 RepID=A0AAV8DXY6_9POAL|nr:ATP-dependent DNA helicase RecG [Rhynchospora pubera]